MDTDVVFDQQVKTLCRNDAGIYRDQNVSYTVRNGITGKIITGIYKFNITGSAGDFAARRPYGLYLVFVCIVSKGI